MPDSFWNDLVHILLWIGDKIIWFFHSEERAVMTLNDWGWPIWGRLLFVSVFNAVLIICEIGFWWGLFWALRHIRFLERFQMLSREPTTPQWILKITRGKPLGPVELAILAFAPWCQKVATFIFTTDRYRFGLKGYLAMCIGGTSRLVLMVFLPKPVIWAMIAGMAVRQLAAWWLENGNRLKNGNKDGKK